MAKKKEPKRSNQFDVDGKELMAEIVELQDMKTTIGEATGSLRSHLKGILDKKGYHSRPWQSAATSTQCLKPSAQM